MLPKNVHSKEGSSETAICCVCCEGAILVSCNEPKKNLFEKTGEIFHSVFLDKDDNSKTQVHSNDTSHQGERQSDTSTTDPYRSITGGGRNEDRGCEGTYVQ